MMLRKYSWLCVLVCVACVVCALWIPSAVGRALADGGAPNLAYIAGAGKGVSIIDIAKQDVAGKFEVPGNPHALFLSYDGRFLYATQPELGQVAILAARTGKQICAAPVPGKPEQLAMDVNNNVLYVAGNETSSVLAIDHLNCAVKRTFKTEGTVHGVGIVAMPTDLATDPRETTRTQLWVASSNAVNVFDTANGQLIAEVEVPDGPEYITAPLGTTAYVTTRKGTVVAIDTASRKTIKLLEGGRYGPMDYDGMTGEIYVPDVKNKRLVILSPVVAGSPLPKQPDRTLALEQVPESVAITSDGQLAFVALQNGEVLMLDVPGRQQVKSIAVGDTPRFIITGLYPPVVASTPQEETWQGTAIVYGAYGIMALLFFVPIVFYILSFRKRKA